MMTQEQFGQAILESITRVTGKCYIRNIFIKKLEPIGFDVALGFYDPETHLHIMGQFDEEEFLKYFEKELKTRQLHRDQHFIVTREYPESKLKCCI